MSTCSGNRGALAALLALGVAACSATTEAPTGPDTSPLEAPHLVGELRSTPVDLVVPELVSGAPGPGRRVRLSAAEYVGTDVHHLLYLPTDWRPGATYPVLVEFAGNGPYRSAHGDVSSGRVEGSSLGYGISAGRGYLWLCLPYVDAGGTHNERQWWGDVQRTVDYCKAVVPRVCEQFGGDPERVVFLGFSRGAIAGNYIGLHDDEIARLWRGFVLHSHYDGVRAWPYAGSDRGAAAERLARLGDRPQWISHEESVDETRSYLEAACPTGRFTFRALPSPNHTDAWVLRDIPLRRELRSWVEDVVGAGG